MAVLATSGSGMFKVAAQQTAKDTMIHHLLSTHRPFFDSILDPKNELNVQIIYTQIDRDKKGKIKFTDHSFNIDSNHYFYPASTVKLPIAALALQKLHELNIPGLDKNTTMITGADGDPQTEVCNDPTTPDGRPTIAHYIRKILLVSDNDAFNRLYEFLGQEYINQSLQQMGYTGIQIIHRLNIFLSEEDNRHTNPIIFMDNTGKKIYTQPAVKSQLIYAVRNTRLGKGYMKGDQLVNEPFDFSKKNRMSLSTLHNIVKAVLFPEAVPEKQRFHLSPDDYAFLRRYMSMTPPESKWAAYDTAEYPSAYVKFLYYGAKGKTEPGLRIFNKTGDAYGFMIDASCFADFTHKTAFMLSAVIYCNSDGILNDDKYDYDSVGLPFMKNLGRIIYQYDLQRKRKYPADLSSFIFSYKD